MTYGFLLLFAFCTHNFLPQLVFLCRSILVAASYNHCLPFECTYHALTICHMCGGIGDGIMNVDLHL